MRNLIRIEFIKMNRSNVWTSMLIIPMIAIIIGSGNYYFNREVLQDYWYSLWTQVSLFYGMFFYAVTIAITASYSWRMEHKSNNWNKILALPYRYFQIIISKIISISIISLYIQFIFMLLYYIMGKFIFQFQTRFPIEILIWGGAGWITSIAICAMQSFISMKTRSFSVPVGIALVLSFIGMGFFVFRGFGDNLMYFSPNSLLITAMSSNRTEILKLSEYIKVLFSTTCFSILFTYLSIISMRRMGN